MPGTIFSEGRITRTTNHTDMPPKTKSSSAAWPPKRTPRATARKSTVSTPNPKVSAKPTADDSPQTPNPSDATATTTTTTPESQRPSLTSPKGTPLTSPNHKSTPKSSPNITLSASPASAPNELTSKSSAEDVSEEAPIPTTTTTAASEPPPPSLASPESTSFISPQHKTTPKSPLTKTSSETAAKTLAPISTAEDASEEAQSLSVNMNSETTCLTTVEKTLGEKVLPAPENVAPEASVAENIAETGQEGGTKTGSKTVVKKTVRVVKKLVKKKVPKRVQTGQSVLSNEDSEKLEPSNDAERPNPSVLGEGEVEKPNTTDSVLMEVENPNPNGTVSMEIENSISNVIVSTAAEQSDSNPDVFVSMEVEKLNSDVKIPKQFEICEGENYVSLTENLSEVSGEPKKHGDEGEMTVSVAEIQLEDQNLVLVGVQSDECKTENVNSEGGEGEEGVKETKTEYVDSGSGEGEEGKGKTEDSEVDGLNAEVGLGDGVLLSGEMEALERRKRRKTEIFIGGLDKDAKEEDIRKVFEEVGEVMEIRLVMNGKTGKNKGFAFVRYASAADAKRALAKYHKVEICGRQCGTSPVEGNDTLFLGNINKKWKSEDVVKLLQEIGIEKIDKVTVMADPNNIEFNRGFAFLELETSKDAQNAYNKLQKKDVLGKHLKIKVEWAKPLIEPDEEEMLKVKSVHAEYIPSSWDEDKVRDYFKKFGEIENVALSRNLRSSRRTDFVFVNYTTREAALACIEAFSREQMNDDGSKVNVKVSLANPLPKHKQIKYASNPTRKELSKEKLKAAQPVLKPHEPRNKRKATSSNYDDMRVDRRSSTTSDLVQLLREQASWQQTRPGFGSGSGQDYSYPSPGRKRPFSGDGSHYADARGYPRTRMESSYPIASASALSQGVGMTSLSQYRQHGADYASESFHGVAPSYFQTRERAPFHGSSDVYRRY